MSFELKAKQVDDRRRVVLPDTCPPHAAVTIQEIDKDTWLVKRRRKSERLVIVAFEHIEDLPDDAEWDKKALALAEHAWKKLPPPEF